MRWHRRLPRRWLRTQKQPALQNRRATGQFGQRQQLAATRDLAKKIGLDGWEVSFANRRPHPDLRLPMSARAYQPRPKKRGIEIASSPMGTTQRASLCPARANSAVGPGLHRTMHQMEQKGGALAFYGQGDINDKPQVAGQKSSRSSNAPAPLAEKGGGAPRMKAGLNAALILRILGRHRLAAPSRFRLTWQTSEKNG